MTRIHHGNGHSGLVGGHEGDDHVGAAAWSIRGSDGVVGHGVAPNSRSSVAPTAARGEIHARDEIGGSHAHRHHRTHVRLGNQDAMQRMANDIDLERVAAQRGARLQRLIERINDTPVTGMDAATHENLVSRLPNSHETLTQVIDRQHEEAFREGGRSTLREGLGMVGGRLGELGGERLLHAATHMAPGATRLVTRAVGEVASRTELLGDSATAIQDGVEGGPGHAFWSIARGGATVGANFLVGPIAGAGINAGLGQVESFGRQLHDGDERVAVAQEQSHQEEMVRTIRQRGSSEAYDGRIAGRLVDFQSDEVPEYINFDRIARSPDYRRALVDTLQTRLANEDY